MVSAKSFHKSSLLKLENIFVRWVPRLERCEANLTSKFCGPWCSLRKSVNSGPWCWVVNQDQTLPWSCRKQSDYAHNNATLLRNHGRHRFWELFFVLDILKDKNSSPAFINRNSFSGKTSYLLIESFLPYKKNSNLVRSCGVQHSVSTAAKALLLFESWSSSLGPRVYDD